MRIGPRRDLTLPSKDLIIRAVSEGSIRHAATGLGPWTDAVREVTAAGASGTAVAVEGRAPGVGLSLLRHSSVYLLGNLLQKATAFLLIPIYTRALSTAQYGLLELANTVVNLALVVAALGVPSAINKCLHRDCPDEAARRRLLGTTTLFTLGCTAVLGGIGWLLQDWLAARVAPGPEGLLVVRAMILWIVFAQLAVIPFEALRATGRAHLYVGLSVAQLAVQSGVTLWLVAGRGWDLAGVLAGNVAGFVTVGIVGGAALARGATWTFDRRLLRASVRYGAAMIPVFVAGFVVTLSDRFFLGTLAGLGVLGVYALGYKFGALLDLLLVMPFQRAWTPMFFSLSHRDDAPRILARVTTFLAGLLALATVGVSLATPPFLRLAAGAEFQGAARFVPLVCLAYVLSGLANCLGNGLVVAEKVPLIGACAALAAASSLVFNAILVPRLQGYGAALAAIVSFGVQLTAVVTLLRRHYPVRLEWRRFAGIGLAALPALAIGLALPPLPLPLDAVVRLALLASYPLLALTLGVVSPDDRAAALAALGEAWRTRPRARP